MSSVGTHDHGAYDAAANPAALVRMCKHGSLHDDCCAYDRIRALETELAESREQNDESYYARETAFEMNCPYCGNRMLPVDTQPRQWMCMNVEFHGPYPPQFRERED